MDDISLTTTSEDGFDTQSVIGEFALAIDPMEETGPNPVAVLVADYASCFLPAVRVGAQKAGYDDLGRMEIDASATLDDEDDLEAIEFTLKVEADVEDPSELAALGEEICHVHAALREDLHADITVEDDAF
ncbi:OsmC family protein [Natrinema hispanicum]|uniref:Organic hydroperoxide reductase OsmC/OhrA n=1 Tax=Natrinema hispanicum TaxID=392421 RepID=A0A1I0I7U9_9EURY|nr:OsmC family protein [Natrinema hispanicum]SDD54197.1 Organic hydroperoxide reductase OsmC/OhrA [Natrinema hispanicum]SET92782.1 Organic hydroperoxide reductase OsmC/OhrA [Natrinema hispanicum]